MLVYKQNPCNQQSVTRWGSSRCCKTGWQRRRLHCEMSSGMFLFGSVTCHESPLSALSALVLMRFERVCLCVSQCVSWRAVLTLFCFFCLSRSSRTRRRRLHHLVLHRPWVTIVLFSGLKICAVQKKKMGVRGGSRAQNGAALKFQGNFARFENQDYWASLWEFHRAVIAALGI